MWDVASVKQKARHSGCGCLSLSSRNPAFELLANSDNNNKYRRICLETPKSVRVFSFFLSPSLIFSLEHCFASLFSPYFTFEFHISSPLALCAFLGEGESMLFCRCLRELRDFTLFSNFSFSFEALSFHFFLSHRSTVKSQLRAHWQEEEEEEHTADGKNALLTMTNELCISSAAL